MDLPGRRLRVMEVVKSFALEEYGGGIERFGLALCDALDPVEFDVTVCGLWRYGTAAEARRLADLAARGVQTLVAADWDAARPYFGFARAVSGLGAALARRPVDILHTHEQFSEVAAAFLWASRQAPVVMRTVHNLEWQHQPWRRWLLTDTLYPMLFATEAGVSQTIVDQLNRRPLARLLRRQAVKLHNAISLERFQNVSVDKAALRRSLNLPPEARVVGAIGRLAEQKGYAYLLEAAARVLQQQPAVYFIIVGQGELEPELKAQAVRLGITPNVLFAGPRSDIEALFAIMDVYASSSLWEGLPTVILESMAAGVAVAATDVMGTRDLIRQGENGWLVPPAQPEALAQGLLTLLADAGLRGRLVEAAYATAQRFSIAAVALDYARLYHQYAAAHPAVGHRP